MKKFVLLFLLLIAFTSCQNEAIEKPDNLIEREKMVDIIYDLSLLQALKSGNKALLDSNRINSNTYIYKKHKIDSLQFAKSNQFYASSDLKKYEKMYDEVNNRLLENKKRIDSLSKIEEKNIKKLPSEKRILPEKRMVDDKVNSTN